MPDTADGISPAAPSGTAPWARLPRSVGGAVVAIQPLRHGLGNATTGGIWRVRGTAGSAILKVARLPVVADRGRAFPTSAEPDHWNYWRRQALVYETGLAATAYARAGIAAPALLKANSRADGVRLFDYLGESCVRLERLSLSHAPLATNLWLRVLR